jgi:hypothetical protein
VAGAGLTGAAALGIAGIAVTAGIIGAVNSPLWVKNTTLATKLEQQGLTLPERQAQIYYTASFAQQKEMRKHLSFLPSKADFDSGNAKLRQVQQATSATEREGMRTAARDTAAASRAAGLTAAQAIRDKDLSVSLTNKVTVPVSINARDVSSASTTVTIRSYGSGLGQGQK